MGLFHKTLKDAEEEARKNKYSNAKLALQNHINEYHEAENEFHHLSRFYNEYLSEIKKSKEYLEKLEHGIGSLEQKREMRAASIQHIQNALKILPEINHLANEIKNITKKLK